LGPTLFKNTYIAHWLPLYFSPTFNFAYWDWYTVHRLTSNADVYLVSGETFAQDHTIVAFEGYLLARIVIEAIRDAVAVDGALNKSEGAEFPLPWPYIIEALYGDGKVIDGHLFNRLVKECPQRPAEQICFCNTMTPNSYIYEIHGPTGLPRMLFDDKARGQRDVAYVHFPSKCAYSLSSWSFPIAALVIRPDDLRPTDLMTEDEVFESYEIFNRVFNIMTRETNYEPTPPTRALRYASYGVPNDDSGLQISLDHFIRTLKPFVIYGSLINRIPDSGNVLTLLSSLTATSVEDPPLVPHTNWRWQNIHLRPTIADYTHALVNYFSINEARFSSVHVIASTLREAELASMSFATWGYDVPVASITVANHSDDWSSTVGVWATNMGSLNPFILAISTQNRDGLIEAAASAFWAANRGTLALSCPMVAVYKVRQYIVNLESNGYFNGTFPPAPIDGAAENDIIFGAFRGAWWLPADQESVPEELKEFSLHPRYQFAMLAIQFSKQLYSQVYFDFQTTAAQVLYRVSVVSAMDSSYGPFSNESCTAAEIEANTKDRRCQCTKGVRTIFVHSVKDYVEQVPSTRTNMHSWTMTTCGIVYQEYVPPIAVDLVLANKALTAGAIAGIAVGVSIFALIVCGAIVYTMLFTGRDNRAAPKDSTKPFTIVFTDIQSSTALWARAPNAMSDAIDQHHRLIRKCLRRHGGYEVKTVGDSFMVAFKEPEDAVDFSLDVQMTLYDAEWSTEINATYVELCLESEVALEQSALCTNDGIVGHALVDASNASTTSIARASNSRASHGKGSVVPSHGGHASNVRVSNSHRETPIAPLSADENSLSALPALPGIVGGAVSILLPSNLAVGGASDANASSTSRNHSHQPIVFWGPTVHVPTSPKGGSAVMSYHDLMSYSQVEAEDSSEGFDALKKRTETAAVPTQKTSSFRSPTIVVSHTLETAADVAKTNLPSSLPTPLQGLPHERNGSGGKGEGKAVSGVSVENLDSARKVYSSSTAATDSQRNANAWNGLRVRIGVHYGMGDIRKDPVTLGYDYYGTVVNTAARVEGVGHGGQILITGAVHEALDPSFLKGCDAVIVALGPQPLRGLDEPIRLHQIVPTAVKERTFPPLRLHIEKETEDESSITDATRSTMSESPEMLIARMCQLKQFSGSVTPDELIDRYHYLAAALAPTSTKYRTSVLVKLGEAWGFEKVAASMKGTESGSVKLLVQLVGKITKAFNATEHGKWARQRAKQATTSTVNPADPVLVDTAVNSNRGTQNSSAVMPSSANYASDNHDPATEARNGANFKHAIESQVSENFSIEKYSAEGRRRQVFSQAGASELPVYDGVFSMNGRYAEESLK
jgi:class 3 adenylate cyclase